MSLPSKSLIATQPHPASLSDFSLPEPELLPGQRYRLGDMLWAKVGSHPYWPCMVFYGPESNTICRPHSKAGTRYAYHVQFFGPLVERAWVPDNANLLPYQGKAAFDEHVQEQGWRTKAARAQFEVRARIQPVWDSSWREAEEAYKLPQLERMFRFGRVYYNDSNSNSATSKAPPADKSTSKEDKKMSRNAKEDSDSDWSETSHKQQLQQQQQRQRERVATSSSKKRPWKVTLRAEVQPKQQLLAVADAADTAVDASDSGSSDTESFAKLTDSSPARFQFQRLKPPPPLQPLRSASLLRPAPVCSRCEEPPSSEHPAGSLSACQGVCARLFHQGCLLRRQPKPLCDNCCRPDRPGGCCELCSLPTGVGDDDDDGRQVCQTCSRVYHFGCLDSLIEAAECAGLPAAGSSQRLLVRREETSLIACPRHACRSCTIDGCPVGQAAVGVQVSCVRCPAAYHSSHRCVPAGSHYLTPTSIVCPDHLLSDSSKRRSNCSATATRHVNAAWCFVCLRSGGALTGCHRCPAAYHPACLPAPSAPSTPFTCARCRLGWQPRCGDLVWVKVGPFRWWPCEILLARHAPQNIQRLGRQVGTFPVRFFGTDEYYWVSLARLFPFRDGDLGESASAAAGTAGTETLELLDKFNEGVALAQEAWSLRDLDRQDARRLLGELAAAAPSSELLPAADRDQQQQQQQPVEASVSGLIAKCDCQRRGRNCGELDGCANRLAGIECHPAACGPDCLNQRLSRPPQQRPELAVFKRPRPGLRGNSDASASCWAAGLSPGWSGGRIFGGQPVLFELPGDLLDPAEAQRRLRLLQQLRGRQSASTKPLMLQLDWRHVLDVGGLATRLGASRPQPQRANARFERWSVGAGGGDLRAGLFAVGAGVAPGEEVVVDWDGAACGSWFGRDAEDSQDGAVVEETEECPDLWTSPQCCACEQPISTCQRHQQQQPQQFHIRCLQCGSRYHAECARLLTGSESVSDPALDNFYCDSCLLTEV